MQALIGQKKEMTQKFLENGKRIPVTIIDVKDNRVIALRTEEKNKYQAVQLGFGITKKSNKARIGHAKGAGIDFAPKFLREVRINDDSVLPEVGTVLVATEVFQPGDIVNVSGISKGKGYAGVVKRHGFHGGPKTHGQSDRWRAPGSIGQGTTPGRVYRGKKMSGRMGVDNVTIENLEIINVTADGVLMIKGLVPGVINNLIYIEKVGEVKNFVPLYKEITEEEVVAEKIAAVEVAEAVIAEVTSPVIKEEVVEALDSVDHNSEPATVEVESAPAADSAESSVEPTEEIAEVPAAEIEVADAGKTEEGDSSDAKSLDDK